MGNLCSKFGKNRSTNYVTFLSTDAGRTDGRLRDFIFCPMHMHSIGQTMITDQSNRRLPTGVPGQAQRVIHKLRLNRLCSTAFYQTDHVSNVSTLWHWEQKWLNIYFYFTHNGQALLWWLDWHYRCVTDYENLVEFLISSEED